MSGKGNGEKLGSRLGSVLRMIIPKGKYRNRSSRP